MSASTTEPEQGGYHHGNLRHALLKAVGEIIDDKGVGGVSLREAARRAGVSHGAPAHHFGDKQGLLTAFSIEGLELFGEGLRQAAATANTPMDRLVAIGLEYLRFATEEQAYFEVMFRSEMHDRDDSDLNDTSAATFSVLAGIASDLAEGDDELGLLALRAWTMVHGLATLWLDGALRNMWDGDDIYELAMGIFEAEAFLRP